MKKERKVLKVSGKNHTRNKIAVYRENKAKSPFTKLPSAEKGTSVKDHFKIREVNKRKYPPPIRETLVCVLWWCCCSPVVMLLLLLCRPAAAGFPLLGKVFFLAIPIHPTIPHTTQQPQKMEKISYSLFFSLSSSSFGCEGGCIYPAE